MSVGDGGGDDEDQFVVAELSVRGEEDGDVASIHDMELVPVSHRPEVEGDVDRRRKGLGTSPPLLEDT